MRETNPPALKRFLSERLPFTWKLRLRRAARAAAAWALRLSERVRGVEPGRDVDARASKVEPFGAADFLLLAHAASVGADDESGAVRGGGAGGARPLKTSIIVHASGDAEATFQCLRSLAREVDLTESEVVVVNNSGDEMTRALLSHFRGLVRVIEGAPGGDAGGAPDRDFQDLWSRFVDAVAGFAPLARGEHLVFLDGAAVVGRDWLRALTDTLEREERAGAVGSMSVNSDGLVQEAGGVVWSDGMTSGYGRGDSPEDRRLAFAREVDFCTPASLAVRGELFERLGGFDARYASAEYAAADICMGVRSLGHKVVYQPASRVTLFKEGRFKAERGREAAREKFRDKWRAALGREHVTLNASDFERASNRKWSAQVVVFDDLIPTPDRDAGSARMMYILRALKRWAHVVFVPTGKLRRPEYERLLWREGIETASVLDYERLIESRNFRAAILSRPHVAAALLSSIRRADPRTRTVFDMVDAHSLRLSREYELTGDGAVAREAERYRKMESRLARECDLVWCASTADEEFMRQMTPGVATAVVPTVHPRQGRGLPFGGRAHILFVGNFRHRPNADAVHFYAREVLPRVRESLPAVELLLVGDNAPREFAEYEPAGVRVMGYVPDIEPVFAAARVSVAPLRFGAGINGKIGEALAHGLPVVTTAIGAAGLALRDGEEALIADTPEGLADATVRLYTDEALWRELSDSGYAHVERHFSPRVVRKIVNDSVRSLLGHFEASLTAPRS
jgi:glycosyltransferase involved in cell wall biosynthesis/GT2 family glycosyltransferase